MHAYTYSVNCDAVRHMQHAVWPHFVEDKPSFVWCSQTEQRRGRWCSQPFHAYAALPSMQITHSSMSASWSVKPATRDLDALSFGNMSSSWSVKPATRDSDSLSNVLYASSSWRAWDTIGVGSHASWLLLAVLLLPLHCLLRRHVEVEAMLPLQLSCFPR